MKLEKLIFAISLAVLFFSFSSCGDEADNLLDADEFLYFKTVSSTVTKGSTTPVNIDIVFSSTRGANATATGEFELIVDNAVEGIDFEVANETNQVVFNKDNNFTQRVTIIPLAEAFENPDPSTIEVRMLNLSNGTIGFPGPDQKNSFHRINMIRVDCDYEISGTYTVTTTMTVPAGCDGVSNEVQVTVIGEGVYEITDLTGGMYANCYGSADNPGIIRGECDGPGLFIEDQPDVVYGDDFFNGSGQINEDGSFQLEWSNGYGDIGISVFVPQ